MNGHGLHLSSSIELLRRGLLVEDPISTNCMPVEAIEAVVGAIVGARGVGAIVGAGEVVVVAVPLNCPLA